MARTYNDDVQQVIERVLRKKDNGRFTIDDLLRLQTPLYPHLVAWYRQDYQRSKTPKVTGSTQKHKIYTENGLSFMKRTVPLERQILHNQKKITRYLWEKAMEKQQQFDGSKKAYSPSPTQRKRLREIRLFCLRAAINLRMHEEVEEYSEKLLESGEINRLALWKVKLARPVLAP